MTASEFYNIARETARIIHNYSWEQNGIMHVMLYGSTLHNSQPNDIDLLVIHNGQKLVPYFYYRKLKPDSPIGEDNARIPAKTFLGMLGYKEDSSPEENVLNNIETLVSPRNVNKIYDFNALNVNLLMDKEEVIWFPDIWNGIRLGGPAHKSIPDLRNEAIQSCRETNFWYTILSEGRIYDRRSGDFSIKVSELFPDALRLFPSNNVVHIKG